MVLNNVRAFKIIAGVILIVLLLAIGASAATLTVNVRARNKRAAKSVR